jgi:hypothetical protein
MSLRERFLAFDERLARQGVPPLTAWWREGIGRWLDAYEQGQVLELYACVGRGAAKSTALYKLALFFTLYGDFAVPVGERHYAVVLSRLKEEAAKGIAIIDRWLSLLGITHRLAGDVVELDQAPRGIRVVAASVAAASGWRAFLVGKDERSKWSESGTEEREGEEIDVSASAMTATHPLAPVLSFGSAYYAIGPFFDSVRGGSTEHRVVLGPAATWVAAPHITEESTRKKERNESKWRREYACEFQSAAEECIYPPEVVDLAIRKGSAESGPWAGCRYVAWGDTAFSRNSCTLCVGTSYEVDGRRRSAIVLAREWRPSPGAPLDPASILRQWAALVAPYGVSVVVIDQYHAESLQSLCVQMGLRIALHVDRPTVPERLQRYEEVLAKFMSGEVELPDNRQLRADLLAVRRHMQQIRLPTTPDGRHADFAPAAVGVLATVAGAIGQAVADDRHRQRTHYAMIAVGGGASEDPILSRLPPEQRHDAALALANGAPIEAVVDPEGYVKAAGRRARDDGTLDRGSAEHDELLRRIGSPAWSGYQPPPPPDPAEVARIKELEARVVAALERDTKGTP